MNSHLVSSNHWILRPMQCISHTTDTNAADNPSLEYGSSPAASEAVYVPNADGSSSNDNRRNTRYVDQSTVTTHSSGHFRHHPLIHHTCTSHRRDYCRYWNSWGWFGGTTSIFMHKMYKFYIRIKVDIGVSTPIGINANHTTHNNQIG